jgi:hypothetical protein
MTRLQRSNANLAAGLQGEARMLQIDIYALEASGFRDWNDLNAVDQTNGHGGDHFSRSHLVLGRIAKARKNSICRHRHRFLNKLLTSSS